jgi:prepilin-type N-terminal cleavage/methylation domain-containing protein
MLVMHDNQKRRRPSDAGYSIVEMMMVVGIIAVLAAVTLPVGRSALGHGRADSTITATMAVLDQARNRAIAERRNFQLVFTAPNRIQVFRVEVTPPNDPAVVTLVTDVILENGHNFHKFAGMLDTPDQFGSGTAIEFDGPGPPMFTSDGSLVDANGDPSNGTLLIGRSESKDSARAITIFGATGLVRSWKWANPAWSE